MSYSKSSTMRSVKTQYRSDRIDIITGRKANWQVIIRTPISEVFKIIRISLPKIRSPVVVRGLLWYQQFALQIELYTGSLKAGASVGCGYLIRFVKLMTLSIYAVCLYVFMKVLTSYGIGKKLMREDIKRKIYKSEYFHKDIKTSQYL